MTIDMRSKRPRGRIGGVLELADRLLPLIAAGTPVAVATAVDVLGSSPHGAGTSMAVTDDGRLLGAVSGGCVEDAALRACRALLEDGETAVHRFGFGDAAAASAGLACGGELDVLVHRLAGAEVAEQLRLVLAGRPAALGVVTAGPPALLGRAVTPASVAAFAREVPGLAPALLAAALTGRRDTGTSGPIEAVCAGWTLRLFVDVAAPARRLLIGGATDAAAALAAAATAIGYRVTVCDPRPAFALPARFPAAQEVVTGRVHEAVRAASLTPRDAVCLLGHDEDLDPLALAAALESAAGYVGALGSRSTAARRRERWRARGVPEALVARRRMPIGLDVGARTPGELAVAVLAEVLAVRSGTDAVPLRVGAGSIHRPVPAG
jgi:xanthine dehydrogenase accessory factor